MLQGVQVLRDLLDDLRSVQFLVFQFVGEGAHHVADDFFGDFHVEEDAVRAESVDECLARGQGRGGEQGGVGRQVEQVAVPVVAHERLRRAAPQQIRVGVAGQFHRVPADFLLLAAAHGGTQRGGQQLAAQADAQDRPFVLEGLIDEAHGVHQEGVAVEFVHAHGAAQDDESGGVSDVLGDGFAGEGAHVLGFQSVALQHLGDDAQVFALDVLQDLDLGHFILRFSS